jgi:DNA-binding NarL/FixJ family response regulator
MTTEQVILDATAAARIFANLIREGRANQEIADMLCLSKGTIMCHRANIRKKLGLATAG